MAEIFIHICVFIIIYDNNDKLYNLIKHFNSTLIFRQKINKNIKLGIHDIIYTGLKKYNFEYIFSLQFDENCNNYLTKNC